MNKRIVAFTGHRPDKLPGGWYGDDGRLCEWIAEQLIKASRPIVIVGGALGIDQIAMRAARYAGCYIILIEPFPGFWKKWPISRIEEYMELKYSIPESACTRRYSNKEEEYAGWKMMKRNEAMVNEATEVWAYWNGCEGGGTANCVRYAEGKDKPVRNLHDEYAKVLQSN